MTKDAFAEKYFSGNFVYGDDFDVDQLNKWFETEKDWYFDFVNASARYTYDSAALNILQFGGLLKQNKFDKCLVLGSGPGYELKDVAKSVSKFFIIEPGQGWWRDNIWGVPSEFVLPHPEGNIAFGCDMFDLIICLGVLHHIANPSHVLSEISRVAKPKTICILREPIRTMGDWRLRKTGSSISPNERGFPLEWLRDSILRSKFNIVSEALCDFPLVRRLRHFGIEPYNNKLLSTLDEVACNIFKWNYHYHRDTLCKKIGPGAVCFVLEKT